MSNNNFTTSVVHYETKDGDKILYPFSPPIYQSYVHENFTKELLDEGRKLTLKDNDHNHRLAGQLKYGRSYHYKPDFLKKAETYILTYVERFFNGLYEQYGEEYKQINRILQVPDPNNRDRWKQGKLRLDSFWINFSQKHDFNPPHTHAGILSFVIYCQVPQEIFSVQTDSNTKRAGEIHFRYGDPCSELMGNEFPCRPGNNLIFIFPSKLTHFVPAYWVDAERISVSGNFGVI